MNPKAKDCLHMLWLCTAGQIFCRAAHAMGSGTASATADMMLMGSLIAYLGYVYHR